MTLQYHQNVSFSGTVNIVDLSSASKKLGHDGSGNVYLSKQTLKPLIHQLKHHAGSKKVKHTINIGDIFIGVNSSYTPAQKTNGIDRFVRGYNFIDTKEPIKEKNITELIEWSKETKEWLKDIRKQEKEQEKIAKKQQKNTNEQLLLKRLLSKFLNILPTFK